MHDHHYNAWFLCLIAVGFVLSVAGCGNGNRATVEGKVTVGDKPAHGGSIAFIPADGQGPSAGAQIEGGKYALTGGNSLLPGEKNVEITVTVKTGKRIAMGRPSPKGTMVDEVVTFSNREKCKITTGQNQIDFDLKPAHEKK
jgi:hypothetical protein